MPPTLSPTPPVARPTRTPLDAFAGTKRGLLEHLRRLHDGAASPPQGFTRLQAIQTTCEAVAVVREAERSEGLVRPPR